MEDVDKYFTDHHQAVEIGGEGAARPGVKELIGDISSTSEEEDEVVPPSDCSNRTEELRELGKIHSAEKEHKGLGSAAIPFEERVVRRGYTNGENRPYSEYGAIWYLSSFSHFQGSSRHWRRTFPTAQYTIKIPTRSPMISCVSI